MGSQQSISTFSTMSVTVEQVRNAREQAKCGGHPYISSKQYCEHVDCLFAEIKRLNNLLSPKSDIEGLDHAA